jgi:hypothetical protein
MASPVCCERCGGTLFLDEGELACLQCAARFDLHISSLAQVGDPGPVSEYVRFDIPWFALRDIYFNHEQVIFLLINLEMAKHPAYFTRPAELAAEIDYRLSQCGLDRYLIESFYTNNISIGDIAKYISMDPERVSRNINSALKYISGWERKDVTYQYFKRSHSRGKLVVQ